MTETCGTCAHAVREHGNKDLMARACYGAPPQLLFMPQQGGVALALVRPTVTISTRACGAWRVRGLEIEQLPQPTAPENA